MPPSILSSREEPEDLNGPEVPVQLKGALVLATVLRGAGGNFPDVEAWEFPTPRSAAVGRRDWIYNGVEWSIPEENRL